MVLELMEKAVLVSDFGPDGEKWSRAERKTWHDMSQEEA